MLTNNELVNIISQGLNPELTGICPCYPPVTSLLFPCYLPIICDLIIGHSRAGYLL